MRGHSASAGVCTKAVTKNARPATMLTKRLVPDVPDSSQSLRNILVFTLIISFLNLNTGKGYTGYLLVVHAGGLVIVDHNSKPAVLFPDKILHGPELL